MRRFCMRLSPAGNNFLSLGHSLSYHVLYVVDSYVRTYVGVECSGLAVARRSALPFVFIFSRRSVSKPGGRVQQEDLLLL